METPTILTNTYDNVTSNATHMVLTSDSSTSYIGDRRIQAQWPPGPLDNPIGTVSEAFVDAITKQKLKEKKMSDRRLVRVLIADPHRDVPVEYALLYDSKEFFTDLTDQELFFDINIKDILEKHNDMRCTFIDSRIKDRTEQLKPARIRDLVMTVLTLAEF